MRQGRSETKADELYVKIILFSDGAANRKRDRERERLSLFVRYLETSELSQSRQLSLFFFSSLSSSVIVATGKLRYINRDSISRQGYPWKMPSGVFSGASFSNTILKKEICALGLAD